MNKGVNERTAKISSINLKTWKLFSLVIKLFILVWTVSAAQAVDRYPRIVPSADGTPISYTSHGTGEPTLLFVHGWSCDSRYWREQVSFFAPRNRVAVLDLAGHGHSGAGRTRYSMEGFGRDVQAVVDDLGSSQVILIGHSMGGSVIAEAARLMPERIIGLIGVDTLENVEYPMTEEAKEQMTAPLKNDFPIGCRLFVQDMIAADTNQQLRDWITEDMAAANPAVALSAMDEMLNQYLSGEAAKIFESIKIPVLTVNGDLWPIDFEANRRHMRSFDATVIKGAGHFLMLSKPEKFNPALQQSINQILTGR